MGALATSPNGIEKRLGSPGQAWLGTCSRSWSASTDLKQPANYHWSSDRSENVDFGTLGDAVRLSEAVIRRLDPEWV